MLKISSCPNVPVVAKVPLAIPSKKRLNPAASFIPLISRNCSVTFVV
ncbi:MAG: hypothetical protein R2836_04750 [Chitinophagales bacterium]